MQVTEDHTACVQPCDQVRDPVAQVERPSGVPGPVGGAPAGTDQRVVECHPHLQRPARHPGHRQEAVAGGGEHVDQLRDTVQSVEQPQHRGLVVEPGDGVGSGPAQTGVRAPLLQDDLLHAGSGTVRAVRQVDPAAVGEVQGLRHAPVDRGVGHGAPVERLAQELRGLHPLRQGEHRTALVGYQRPVRPGDREDTLAVRRGAPAAAETPVADVQGPVLPAQVGQDPWPRPAAHLVLQTGQDPVQLVVVARVEREHLAARRARGVLEVVGEDQRRTGQELDRDPVLERPPHDQPDDLGGVVRSRGDVHLPALIGQLHPGGRRTTHGPLRSRSQPGSTGTDASAKVSPPTSGASKKTRSDSVYSSASGFTGPPLSTGGAARRAPRHRAVGDRHQLGVLVRTGDELLPQDRPDGAVVILAVEVVVVPQHALEDESAAGQHAHGVPVERRGRELDAVGVELVEQQVHEQGERLGPRTRPPERGIADRTADGMGAGTADPSVVDHPDGDAVGRRVPAGAPGRHRVRPPHDDEAGTRVALDDVAHGRGRTLEVAGRPGRRRARTRRPGHPGTAGPDRPVPPLGAPAVVGRGSGTGTGRRDDGRPPGARTHAGAAPGDRRDVHHRRVHRSRHARPDHGRIAGRGVLAVPRHPGRRRGAAHPGGVPDGRGGAGPRPRPAPDARPGVADVHTGPHRARATGGRGHARGDPHPRRPRGLAAGRGAVPPGHRGRTRAGRAAGARPCAARGAAVRRDQGRLHRHVPRRVPARRLRSARAAPRTPRRPRRRRARRPGTGGADRSAPGRGVRRHRHRLPSDEHRHPAPPPGGDRCRPRLRVPPARPARPPTAAARQPPEDRAVTIDHRPTAPAVPHPATPADHTATGPDGRLRLVPDGAGALTGVDVRAGCAAAAAALRSHRVTAGDRVALVAENSIGSVLALLALMHTGVSLVLLDPRQDAGGRARALARAGVRTVVCDPAVAVPAGLARIDLPALLLRRLDPAPSFELDLATWRGRDDALIVFSSGTTGEPTGVVRSGESVYANIARTQRRMGYVADDVFLPLLPFSHQYGLSLVLLWWCSGGRLVLVPHRRADRALDAIGRHGVTVVDAAPSTYHSLLNLLGSRGRTHLGGVRMWCVGGAPLGAALTDRFAELVGRPLLDGYGSSEAGNIALSSPADPRLCGLPLPGIEVQVVDPAGRPVDDGEIGRIVVDTPDLMTGVLGTDGTVLPARTRLLHTGDIGYRTPEGHVAVLGRDGAVHRHGHTLYPEALARRAEAAGAPVQVLTVDNERRGTSLVFVVADPARRDARFWRQELRPLLSEHEQPNKVAVVGAFPLNRTGKVDVPALRALLDDGGDSVAGPAALPPGPESSLVALPDRLPALDAVTRHLVEHRDEILEILTEVSNHRTADAEIVTAIDTLRGAVGEVSARRPAVVDRIAVFMPSNIPLYAYVLYLLVPALYGRQITFRPSSHLRDQLEQLHTRLAPVHGLPITLSDTTQREFVAGPVAEADVAVFTGTYANAERIRDRLRPEQLFVYFGQGSTPSSSVRTPTSTSPCATPSRSGC
ncbi:hypothetical protein L7F22_056256 [Adiantum nelumboides]|nr:hypothetical protein [Adiantum nelumboides]